MSKLQIDQYSPQGKRKQFSGQNFNIKIFRVLNLRKFFKNFSKLRSKFRNFIAIFLKKLKFLTRFHSGLSFAFHWCLNWFLQNLANVFSSGEKICWKRTKENFLPIFFKKPFLTGFYQKSTIIDPPFFGVSHVNTCQKLYILEKKSKITKEFVKNHDFLEKFDFYDFNFSAFLEVYTCARPTSFYSYRVKKSRKFDFVAIFQKISTRDVFCQAYTWYPKFFYVKKMKIFKLWFLAQKVFKMA